MESEHGIKMTRETQQEVDDMCSLGAKLVSDTLEKGLAEGLAEGRAEGLAEGRAEGRIDTLLEVFKNSDTESKAIDILKHILKASDEEIALAKEKYLAQIKDVA